jgi:hypothetical protein
MLDSAIIFVAAGLLASSPAKGVDGPPPTEPGSMQVDMSAAAGPCLLDLRVAGQAAWRGVYGRGYEPASAEALEQTDVTVLHQGEACQWFLTAERAPGGAFLTAGGGGQLAFDVLQSPNGPSLLSEDVQGTTFSRLQGAFGAGTGAQGFPLFVSIAPGQMVRAGRYAGQTVVRLYRLGDGAPELVAQAPLAISTAVPSVLSVSSREFTPGAAGGGVDLGDLERGASRTLGFDVVANSDVSLSFRSINGGVLRHQAGARGIPYRLAASGRAVSLSAAGAVERFTVDPGTPLVLDLMIEVDPAPGAAAGTYHDELIVTFKAEA